MFLFSCPDATTDIRQQKQQRLIVRNLSFLAKQDDLVKTFSEFGPLSEVRCEEKNSPPKFYHLSNCAKNVSLSIVASALPQSTTRT